MLIYKTLIRIAACLVFISFFVIFGCESRKVTTNGGEVSTNNNSKKTSNSDPAAELRKIAERGKKQAPQEKYILENVNVDVRPTSSLVHPYVGRVVSTWISKNDASSIDQVCIYYKYQDEKWRPTWANRGGSRASFTEPLVEAEAMRTPPDSRLAYPWTGASYKFTIWVP